MRFTVRFLRNQKVIIKSERKKNHDSCRSNNDFKLNVTHTLTHNTHKQMTSTQADTINIYRHTQDTKLKIVTSVCDSVSQSKETL